MEPDKNQNPAAVAEATQRDPLPILNLDFTCDAYSIRISAEASPAAVNFAIAALRTFKNSYFPEAVENESISPD